MKLNGNLLILAFMAAATLPVAARGLAATIPVTGWAVHNGTSAVGGTAAAPTFTPGDNITAMAPFAPVSLANDGDFVEVSTVFTMIDRTTTGVNSLNTQVRFGLFNGPNGPVAASDIPNTGFIIEYTNGAGTALIREQSSLTQVNPFTSPTNIGNGTQVTGGSIQGANPGPVTLTLKLTRNAGNLDLSGSISGTDSVTTNPFLVNYVVNGFSSATFPTGGPFTFNRIGLFLGDNVNAASAELADTTVRTIPEPCGLLLAAGIFGGVLASRSRGQAR
jgi:hypothetical protein